MAENQNPPSFSSLGKGKSVSLALTTKSAKPSGPFSPGMKSQAAFFMVKNPGLEAGLPGFVILFCYFLLCGLRQVTQPL